MVGSGMFIADVFLQRVDARRRELGIRSERAVCIRAGLSPNFLRAIRTGRAQGPTADSLARLADGLQCSTDHLLGRDQDTVPAADPNVTVQP
jgi:transcriptional regulator with XRE-family HTH domain